MQRINTTHMVGLQTDLADSLRDTFTAMAKAWAMDKYLATKTIDMIRINPLQGEQHPTTVRGVTVIHSSDVPMGQVQLISVTPF